VRRALAILFALAAAGGIGAVLAAPVARLGAAYTAKIGCSEIFLARRPEADVRARDFAGISPALDYVSLLVDHHARATRAHLFGLGAAKAVYRDGYGCVLADGAPEALPALAPVSDAPLPTAINDAAYAAAFDRAFGDPVAGTRALLVVRDGVVIAERYAEGFSAETPLLSWSMAKSVTASMVGAAVLRGLVDLDAPAPVPEWSEDDPRTAITWGHLLQMQSGLAFSEDYGAAHSDVSRMLFRARDAAKVAAEKPLAHKPGDYWSYSSGTTNILQRALRQRLEAQGVSYHAFAREALFAPLGMASATMEADASGTFIGSSYVYATARDWAKLGLLYLADGAIGEERLLPQGWSAYVSTPADKSDGAYGAQFRLNRPGAEGREKYAPGLPDSAYFMTGHEGQYVTIIPDKNLIIVRAGTTRGPAPMSVVAPVFAAIYDATP
jgi:CubicO group peptidase (beta-lactamase class C family)